nr:hypothetical protein [Tanacetum cinerariifolium]
MNEEVFQAEGELMKWIQIFLEKFICIAFEEKPQILFQAWEFFFAIQYSKPENPNELFQKLLEDLKELAEYEKSPSKDRSNFLNDNEDHSDQNKESQENYSKEIATLNSNQEKVEPSQDFDIRQMIREECCVEAIEEQKQSMEDTMLELVKICRQKELLCIYDNVDDLIESANNTKLLSINSQRLDNKEHEVKNVVEQPAERGNLAPILSTKEPEYSPSMGYENSNTTPETESDEIIKSGVEELVPILSENEVTLEDKRECNVLVYENTPVCDDHSEIFSDSKDDDDISSDEESFKDIEYVEASLPDPEIFSVEEENVVQQEEEESDNSLSDNFSPEFKTFCYHTEETRSGNTTTHANYSLPEYDSFCFEIKPDQERMINVLKNNIPDDSRDPLWEEADLFLASENSIPLDIENVANDSKGDIRFLEELLIGDFILSHKSSDSNFEDNLPVLRPPLEPPNAYFKLDFGNEISVVMNKFECLMDEFDDSFMFDKVFSLLSAESEDTIFDPGKDYAENAKNRQKPDNINTRMEVSSKSRISKQFYQNNQALKFKYQRSKCQPIDQNNDSSDFDQIQSSRYPVNHHLSQEDVEEVLQDKETFMLDTQTFLEKFNCFSFGFTPRVLTIAWERINKIKYVLTEPEEIPELMYKLREDGDLEKSPDAVTTVLPTEEPEYSLSMAYEHLNIIPETESDEVTEYSAKNLLPIPSKCEVTSEDETECDVPDKEDSSSVFMTFSNPLFDNNDDLTSSDDESLFEEVPIEEFKVYSNPLFDDDEINSDKLDPHCFNVESDFVESLLNRDTFIESSPKFNFLLKEFSGELTHINPEIKEADFDFEEEIRLIENLMYDNSSPRLPKELNAEIADTIASSLIPVQDNDSQREEIDIVSRTDELLPPSFKNDDYDSEGEIGVVEELLVDNSICSSDNELSNFDQDNPLFPRPPPEPPDVEFLFNSKPDVIAEEISDELNEDECFDPGREIDVFTNFEDDDYFPFMFVILIFLPYFIYPEVSPLLLSAESEDTIFDLGISV